MLSPTAFAEQRQAISRSGPPSTGDNLLGMEIDFLAELGDPAYADNPHPLWTEPIVDRQPDWLIHLSATARPGATPAQIEQALTTAWTQTLRYTYREAHTVLTTPTSVTLQAITQIDPGDLWVTAQAQVVLPAPPST